MSDKWMIYSDNYIYKSSIAPQVFGMNLAQAELENNVCMFGKWTERSDSRNYGLNR